MRNPFCKKVVACTPCITPLSPPIFGVQNGGMQGGAALEALQRAETLAPGSAQIRAMFGLYWQRQRDWQKARAEFESAAQLEGGRR